MSAPRSAKMGLRLGSRLIAISVSEADDLAQLGLRRDELDRVLEAVLTTLVSQGARIAYGGRIVHAHNFTLVMSRYLGEAYRRFDVEPGTRPFVHFVAAHRLLETPVPAFLAHMGLLAPYGETWICSGEGVAYVATCIDPEAPRYAVQPWEGLAGDPALPEFFHDADSWSATRASRALAAAQPAPPDTSFTRMRAAMAELCDLRVAVGGRKTGFAGKLSGLCEEALLTIAARKPLALLGGFGGAARDMAVSLALLPQEAAVPALTMDDKPRYRDGLARLRDVRGEFAAVAGPHLPLLRGLAATDSLFGAADALVRYAVRATGAQAPTDPSTRSSP
jgi:hypothetical protein